MPVHLEHQSDRSFAVYVGGDDDTEGEYDRLFAYGVFEGRRITKDEARGQALEYAQKIAQKFGGMVEHVS